MRFDNSGPAKLRLSLLLVVGEHAFLEGFVLGFF